MRSPTSSASPTSSTSPPPRHELRRQLKINEENSRLRRVRQDINSRLPRYRISTPPPLNPTKRRQNEARLARVKQKNKILFKRLQRARYGRKNVVSKKKRKRHTRDRVRSFGKVDSAAGKGVPKRHNAAQSGFNLVEMAMRRTAKRDFQHFVSATLEEIQDMSRQDRIGYIRGRLKDALCPELPSLNAASGGRRDTQEAASAAAQSTNPGTVWRISRTAESHVTGCELTLECKQIWHCSSDTCVRSQ